MRETVAHFNWRLHAFVLMGNHDHLFLETPEGNLSAGMQQLNGRYASYFNHRRKRAGHLFQGRFHAQLIESDLHYREVSRYVHLNPVRAGIVDRPEDWEWSSYPGYHDSCLAVEWVVYSSVLKEFGTRNINARSGYRRFVQAGMTRDLPVPWERDSSCPADRSSPVPGSDDAPDRVTSPLDGRSARLRRAAAEVERIARTVRATVGVPGDSRPRPGRRLSRSRAIAAYLARERFGHPPSRIAPILGYASHSGVLQAIRRLEPHDSTITEAIDRALVALEKCDDDEV
jgi:REP element-mobilizing transposase RayT